MICTFCKCHAGQQQPINSRSISPLIISAADALRPHRQLILPAPPPSPPALHKGLQQEQTWWKQHPNEQILRSALLRTILCDLTLAELPLLRALGAVPDEGRSPGGPQQTSTHPSLSLPLTAEDRSGRKDCPRLGGWAVVAASRACSPWLIFN